MRLSSLSKRLITENIRKRDFFDFYALLYAYQDKRSGDPDKQQEITRRLDEISTYIYRDFMRQMKVIIANRLRPYVGSLEELADPKSIGGDEDNILRDIIDIYKRNGAQFGENNDDADELEPLPVTNIEDIDGRALFNDLVDWQKRHPDKKVNFYSGETWFKLAEEYLKLCQMGSSLNNRIMAIDKLCALQHHGGTVADKFDEFRWLERALHTRAVAEPAEIVQMASSDVRDLVGNYGIPTKHIGDIDRLHVALDRAAATQPSAHFKVSGNKIHAAVSFDNEHVSEFLLNCGFPPIKPGLLSSRQTPRLVKAIVSINPDEWNVKIEDPPEEFVLYDRESADAHGGAHPHMPGTRYRLGGGKFVFSITGIAKQIIGRMHQSAAKAEPGFMAYNWTKGNWSNQI